MPLSAHARHDSTTGICAACEQDASDRLTLDDLVLARRPRLTGIVSPPSQLSFDLTA